MRLKALALIYVFATATVAPRRRRHLKRKKKEDLRLVLSHDEYREFDEIGKGSVIDDSDGAIVAWSMALKACTRDRVIRTIKHDYQGTPTTRHRARVQAQHASPKVQKAFRRYNRMLESDLTMVEILSKIDQIDKTFWSYGDVSYFDELIDTQMDFTCL